MKKLIPSAAFVALVLCSSNCIYAQQFSAGELLTINPSQVIIENYIIVNLSKEIIDDASANRFDINNPYSFLQIVNDATGNRYHILFQTSFTGKILFLSYSSNLLILFSKKSKPMFLFNHCLKEINNHISPVQITEAAVQCIVERLNYCYDN